VHKIFLVDDEPFVLPQLVRKTVFADYGYEISGYTADTKKAVKEIKRLSPDVVFTAIKTQGISGIEIMDTLKNNDINIEYVVLCSYTELADVRRFFSKYRFEYLIKPVDDKDLAIILNRLSGKLSHTPPVTDIISSSKILNEILAYLNDYSAMRHTLTSIGKKWDINPNTICNLFARHLDTTFIAYLTQLRMEHAEQLLAATDKSIKEIAYLCGYNDYFFFCRVFKERNNCTPTQYRLANSKTITNKINNKSKRGLFR